MTKILALILITFTVNSQASVKLDFILAQMEPLPLATYTTLGPGGPVSTKATLEVSYWVQPCAGQQFDQFVVTNSVDAEGVKQMRVGVLISNSGIMCAGPTKMEKKTLIFEGPFNLPGEQPEIKALRF